MYTLEKKLYLSLMYTIYANASNNTGPSYTHIGLYMVWRV